MGTKRGKGGHAPKERILMDFRERFSTGWLCHQVRLATFWVADTQEEPHGQSNLGGDHVGSQDHLARQEERGTPPEGAPREEEEANKEGTTPAASHQEAHIHPSGYVTFNETCEDPEFIENADMPGSSQSAASNKPKHRRTTSTSSASSSSAEPTIHRRSRSSRSSTTRPQKTLPGFSLPGQLPLAISKDPTGSSSGS